MIRNGVGITTGDLKENQDQPVQRDFNVSKSTYNMHKKGCDSRTWALASSSAAYNFNDVYTNWTGLDRTGLDWTGRGGVSHTGAVLTISSSHNDNDVFFNISSYCQQTTLLQVGNRQYLFLWMLKCKFKLMKTYSQHRVMFVRIQLIGYVASHVIFNTMNLQSKTIENISVSNVATPHHSHSTPISEWRP